MCDIKLVMGAKLLMDSSFFGFYEGKILGSGII